MSDQGPMIEKNATIRDLSVMELKYYYFEWVDKNKFSTFNKWLDNLEEKGLWRPKKDI